MMDYVESRCRAGARDAWKEELKALVRKGDYKGALLGMAQNYGHRGDIAAMIEDFCENADPLEA